MYDASLSDQNQKLFRHERYTLARHYLASDYQLDFFSTGKGGFAICLRYGLPGDMRLMIYDGGTTETGKVIVEHVRRHYDTPVVHDLICSHPIAEQCLGLFPILESLDVKRLWMHRPWLFSELMSQYLYGQHRIDPELARHFEDSIALTFMLEDIAHRGDVPISEPFQGAQIGPMRIMSPHRDWYIHRLVPDFMNPTPAPRRLSSDVVKLLARFGIQRGSEDAPSDHAEEANALDESGQCSPEMESSVVLYGLIGGHGILLTGNAGLKALSNTAAYAEHLGIHTPAHLRFFQVPHCGDQNHLSPSILDRLIGVEQPSPPAPSRLTAFVSTPYHAKELPHRYVVQALLRRGVHMVHAQGQILDARSGLAFTGFGGGKILPFSDKTKHEQ